MTRPNSTHVLSNGDTISSPAEVLQEAVAGVLNTCSVQLGIELDHEGDVTAPNPRDAFCGSSIAVSSHEMGWHLAVVCNEPGSNLLTRNMFALEEQEEPEPEDVADALGEIANIAAGAFKHIRSHAGESIDIGLPAFLGSDECGEFFARYPLGLARRFKGPDGIAMQVILCWQE